MPSLPEPDRAPAPSSECILRFSERVTVAEARQELDRHLATLRAGSSAATSSGAVQAVADLQDLHEVDTSALAVIIALDRESRRVSGQPLRIRHAPGNIMSLARLSSLSAVLTWEGGVPDPAGSVHTL
jgi:ABC-type transporter Mla MlaB component